MQELTEKCISELQNKKTVLQKNVAELRGRREQQRRELDSALSEQARSRAYRAKVEQSLDVVKHKLSQKDVQINGQHQILTMKSRVVENLKDQIEQQKVLDKEEMNNFDNFMEGMCAQMVSLPSFHDDDHLQVDIEETKAQCLDVEKRIRLLKGDMQRSSTDQAMLLQESHRAGGSRGNSEGLQHTESVMSRDVGEVEMTTEDTPRRPPVSVNQLQTSAHEPPVSVNQLQTSPHGPPVSVNQIQTSPHGLLVSVNQLQTSPHLPPVSVNQLQASLGSLKMHEVQDQEPENLQNRPGSAQASSELHF